MRGVGVSGWLSPNCLSILARNAHGDHEVAALSGEHVCGDVVHQPAIDQRLAVPADRTGKPRQVDAFENCVDGVSPVPNHSLPTHQIDAYGETGQWQLLQLPVGQVSSEHRIEVAAAVFVQQVPITAAGEPPKEPRKLQIGGELAGAVIAIQTGAIKDCRSWPLRWCRRSHRRRCRSVPGP